MMTVTPQTDVSASMEVLRQALSLPETTHHLSKQIRAQLCMAGRSSIQESDDLTQDCLAKAWEKRETFDATRGNPSGWLHGFAVRQVKKHVRQSHRLPMQLPQEQELVDQIAYVKKPENPFHLQKEFVLSVLHLFSVNDQVLIHASFFEQKSSGELVALLNLKPGNIRTRQTRVRIKLRELYQQAHPEDAS